MPHSETAKLIIKNLLLIISSDGVACENGIYRNGPATVAAATAFTRHPMEKQLSVGGMENCVYKHQETISKSNRSPERIVHNAIFMLVYPLYLVACERIYSSFFLFTEKSIETQNVTKLSAFKR